MKVKATKLANGKLQLEIIDNSNSKAFLKFGDAKQITELSNLISEEAQRMKTMENHFKTQQRKFNFQ